MRKKITIKECRERTNHAQVGLTGFCACTHVMFDSPLTEAQCKIEKVHQRLMNIRDSTPSRRGHITAEREYTREYLRAFKQGYLSEFYAAAEKYRHFLQDGRKKTGK